MGQKDIFAKKYLARPDIFADAFNAGIFHGEQRIPPGMLNPMQLDLRQIDRNGMFREYHRDVLMSLTTMQCGPSVLALLGIEHQTTVDYSMPLRCLNYDVANWMAYRKAIMARNRKREREAGKSVNPLGTFHSTDRLPQIVTMVLYLGTEPWDAPTNLRDLIEPCFPEFNDYLPDYRICLLTPDTYGNEWNNHFKTELGNVVYYSLLARDRQILSEYARNDSTTLEPDTIRMIYETIGLEIKPMEGITTMCQAIREMEEDFKQQGRLEAQPIWLAKGRAEGEKNAIRQLIAYMRQTNAQEDDIVRLLTNAYGLSKPQATQLLSIP